jgi:hypothetical protein
MVDKINFKNPEQEFFVVYIENGQYHSERVGLYDTLKSNYCMLTPGEVAENLERVISYARTNLTAEYYPDITIINWWPI